MTSVYSDKPSYNKDLLQYNKYAKALSELILEAETPFTIWISWEWGYWKTTLLNLTSYYLDKEKFNEEKSNIIDFLNDIENFHSEKWIWNKDKDTLFFSIFLNTWPFINSKDIWESIFEQIMFDLIKLIRSDSIWYNDTWKFLVKTISGLIKTIKVNWKINFWLGEIWWEFDPSKFSLDDINYSNFKIEIEDILKEIIKKKWKLLIFIDDLDRIYPKQALEVMLFIKNFLDIKDCIFLIWSDNKILEDWLKVLYWKERKDIDEIKKSFFEKIYQLEFKLPQIQKWDIKKYLNWFDEIKVLIDENEENYNEILIFLLSLTETLNPRKIKRAINIFKFLKNLIVIDEKYNLLLLEIAIIYEKDINLYNNIKNHIFNNIELYDILKTLESTTLNNHIVRNDEVLKWILNVFGSSDILKVDNSDILNNLIDNFINSFSFNAGKLNLNILIKYLEENKINFNKKEIAKILNWIINNDWWNGINQIIWIIDDNNLIKLLNFMFSDISIEYYALLKTLNNFKNTITEYDDNRNIYNKTIHKLNEIIKELDKTIPF